MSTRQCLNRETSILELSQHLLDRTNFVDNVKVILLVHLLFKCAGKLLHRVYEYLQTLAIHFKRLG